MRKRTIAFGGLAAAALAGGAWYSSLDRETRDLLAVMPTNADVLSWRQDQRDAAFRAMDRITVLADHRTVAPSATPLPLPASLPRDVLLGFRLWARSLIPEPPPEVLLASPLLSRKGKAKAAPPADPLEGQPDFAGDEADWSPPTDGPLAGRHVLVTAGPTHEPIDPVRYIANRSSGKQGNAIAAALAALPDFANIMDWPIKLQDAATPSMAHITDFHNLLLYIIVGIVAFVTILLIYVMIRFNARANPTPSTTTHNVVLEVLWTVVPVIILIIIAIPSFKLLFFNQIT